MEVLLLITEVEKIPKYFIIFCCFTVYRKV